MQSFCRLLICQTIEFLAKRPQRQAAWRCSFISTDIQEFYEVTLLNTQKSCEQKLEEVNHMAEQWEKSVSLQKSERAHSVCPEEEVSLLALTEKKKKKECCMHVLCLLAPFKKCSG